MGIEYKKNRASFSGVVGVAEAEALLEWLQSKSAPRVDLAACTHLHSANLQVLMAARPIVSAWPADAGFASWLESALRVP